MTQLQLGDVEKYEDSEKDLKGKSLLNRNAQSEYKFAHKSIFEYFLAKRCFEDNDFLKTFNFDGMSATTKFHNEMLIQTLNGLEGNFYYTWNGGTISFEYVKDALESSNNFQKNFDGIKITNGIENLNIYLFSNFENLKELIVFKKKNLRLFYDFYLLFLYPFNVQLELKELRELRKQLKRLELPEVREWLERLEQLSLQEQRELGERLELRELQEPQKLSEQRERLLNKSDEEILKELKPIDDFLKEMKELKKELPNCKIYY